METPLLSSHANAPLHFNAVSSATLRAHGARLVSFVYTELPFRVNYTLSIAAYVGFVLLAATHPGLVCAVINCYRGGNRSNEKIKEIKEREKKGTTKYIHLIIVLNLWSIQSYYITNIINNLILEIKELGFE